MEDCSAAHLPKRNKHATQWLMQLLEHGELAPGLTTAEFAARRQALAEALPPDSVALLPAPPLKYIAGVVPYPYRPVSPLQSNRGHARAAS